MKKGLFFLFLLCSFVAEAQFSLRIVVTAVATRKDDNIYIAGNFNGWNPADEKYKLKPFAGGRKSIVIKDLQPGTYAFKLTRGGFDKVETTADGRDISDRVVEVNSDITQEITIAGWKDDYPDKPKPYTASPQVKVMDTAFAIPQLNTKRRIWIYLPKGYAGSTKTYPVLYMHDGQNLFNEQTAAFGEWGVDECLDSLQRITGRECIVVGIDHGRDNRNAELSPYDFSNNGTTVKAQGTQYADFVVNTLKPYIDSKYRTKKGPDYTFTAGSSLGGLMSLYIVLKYPTVFGTAGVFSPSLWLSNQIFTDAENLATVANTPRFYIYGGGQELASLKADMDKLSAILNKKPRIQTRVSFSPLGKHNEASWRGEFPYFYRWMMQ